MEPFFSCPDVTISLAATLISLQPDASQLFTLHTGRDHCLDEVPDVAEHHTEALYWVRVTRLGLHGLDLYALQHGMFNEAAAGLEYAPAWC
jgi:hypothetical protein